MAVNPWIGERQDYAIPLAGWRSTLMGCNTRSYAWVGMSSERVGHTMWCGACGTPNGLTMKVKATSTQFNIVIPGGLRYRTTFCGFPPFDGDGLWRPVALILPQSRHFSDGEAKRQAQVATPQVEWICGLQHPQV